MTDEDRERQFAAEGEVGGLPDESSGIAGGGEERGMSGGETGGAMVGGTGGGTVATEHNDAIGGGGQAGAAPRPEDGAGEDVDPEGEVVREA